MVWARASSAIERNHPDALAGLGRELMWLQKPEEAIPYLERSLAQRRAAWLHNELGVAYEMTSRFADARDQYRAGLELAPGDLTLRTNFGRSIALTGDYDRAIAVLRAVVAEPSAGESHREALALVYAFAGDPDSAAEVSRVDVPRSEVNSRLSYYRLLREVARSGDQESVAEVLGRTALRTISAAPPSATAGTDSLRDPGYYAARDMADNAPFPSRSTSAAAMDETVPSNAAMGTRETASPVKLYRSDEPNGMAASKPSKRKASRKRMKPGARRASAKMGSRAGSNKNVAYQVQLAAFRTRQRAELGWRILNRSAPNLLDGLEHFVRDPNPDFEWDRLYRLRTLAYASPGPAETLCAQLKNRTLDCLVVETKNVPGLRFQPVGAMAKQTTPADQSTAMSATATGSANVSRAPLPPEGQADTATMSAKMMDEEASPRSPAKRDTSSIGDFFDGLLPWRRKAKESGQPDGRYEIQLGAYRTKAWAERGWRVVNRVAPDVLDGLDYYVKGPDSHMKSSRLYLLRTQPLRDRVDATTLCSRLKSHQLDCLVVPTGDRTGRAAPSKSMSMPRPTPPPPVDENWPDATDAPPHAKGADSGAYQSVSTDLGGTRPAMQDRTRNGTPDALARRHPVAPGQLGPIGRAPDQAAYQVQLGAYKTRTAALRARKDLKRLSPDLLGPLAFAVKHPSPSNQRDRLYRLRALGFPVEAPAQSLCQNLKQRKIDCLVVRIERMAGMEFVKTAASFRPGDRNMAIVAPPPPPPVKAKLVRVSARDFNFVPW